MLRWNKMITIFLVGILLSGCYSYQPLPLALEQYSQEWSNSQKKVAELEKLLQNSPQKPSGPFDLSDGLSLGEAELVALVLNPRLREIRLAAKVEEIAAIEAGKWDDPTFQIDIARILGGVADPWILATAIGFTIPLSGRLTVEKELAATTHKVALLEALKTEWELKQQLREEWFRWSAALETFKKRGEFLQKLQKLQKVLNALVKNKEISFAVARVFQFELSSKKLKQMKLESELAESQLKIKSLLGLHPNAPFKFLPNLKMKECLWPSSSPEMNKLLSKNPRFEVVKAEYQKAEEELKLEIKKQYPDLEFGPNYELEEGESRLGLSFGSGIPLWNGNRAEIEIHIAKRLQVKAKVEALYQELYQEYQQTQHKKAGLSQQKKYFKDVIFPLIAAQQKELKNLSKLREFNASLILEALKSELEIELDLIDLKLQDLLLQNPWQDLLSQTAQNSSNNSKKGGLSE